MTVNPDWNVKMQFIEIIKTHYNLLEPQHMIVELPLQGPFLVQQVGSKWVVSG